MSRLAPVAVLVALAAAFFAFGLDRYVSFDALREHREFLQNYVAKNTLLAALTYIVIYAVMVAASVPGATVFTVSGGFLFGILFGTVCTVIAATLGATAVFLIARSAFGDVLRSKAGGRTEKMLDGFRENAFSYLLVLRLVPLFPFFLVNVAPAFASVPLRTYVAATFLGIIPGTAVYVQVGTGLGSIFDAGGTFTLANVLTTEMILALAGLAILSLVPVAYKRFKTRKAG